MADVCENPYAQITFVMCMTMVIFVIVVKIYEFVAKRNNQLYDVLYQTNEKVKEINTLVKDINEFD